MALPQQWLMSPTSRDVEEAARRLGGRVRRTPVLTSESLNTLTGAQLWFKCEHLQKTGAFKFRGATNAVVTLPADLARHGVATHSSGNHGAALACAARAAGIRAYIVVPEDVSATKLANIERYGGQVRLCEANLAARESMLDAVVEETGATFVHPYDNAAVIAGQGTATLELIGEVGALDAVVTPVGGGGLLARRGSSFGGARTQTPRDTRAPPRVPAPPRASSGPGVAAASVCAPQCVSPAGGCMPGEEEPPAGDSKEVKALKKKIAKLEAAAAGKARV